MIRTAAARALTILAPAALVVMGWSASGRATGVAGGDERLPASRDWPFVHGDPGATRHSPLAQITRDNVGRLEVAWRYHTGDADPAAFTTIECTPIVIGGVMYITTARGKVVALDAANGTRRWEYDAAAGQERQRAARGVNRGVAYWSDPQGRGRARIFHGSAHGELIALDAETGTPLAEFGRGGIVKLRPGVEPEFEGRLIGITSAPLVVGDVVVAGASVGEGPEPAASGDIVAWDVRTGAERWRFHTVPRPGQYGHETWEDGSWKGRGGVNPWAGLTADPARGLLFAATGSAAFDFYGGDRKGDNLFANSTIALEAATGRRVWHFQTVRHDLWDYDLPHPPMLVRVTRGGRPVDAVAQVTKTGFVYLFDRDSGKPLVDIVERSVPTSGVAGERPAAAQPIPASPPPFIRQSFAAQDVFGTTPEALADARARFAAMRHGTIFTPPSLEGTVALPGTRGGATWSGASFDPATGWLFVNANEIANVLKLVATPAAPQPYRFAAYQQFLDLHGYPAITPPWGTLSAIDLGAGRIAWQVPLGEHPELAKRGLRGTGTENFGGTIVTAGGLVFIGGSKDEKFRAFDASTGRVLWEHQLDAGAYATPATYAVGGRQFVVVAAGGGGKPRTRSGDAFVAFALPRSEGSNGGASAAAAGPSAAGAAAGQAAASPARPNIIVVQADDLGWGDLSAYGQQRFATPELDRMAREGLRFTQYYSGSTVCAPSRAALMTGRHTGHARIRGNGDFPLENEDVTLAEVLKSAGYRTAVVGKWGLGDEDTPGRPDRQGFDEAFGFLRHPHAHRQYTERLWRNGAWIDISPDRDYVNDRFSDAARDFVDRAGSGPFFLYLAYTAPHAELRAPEDSMARFRGAFAETPFVNAKADGLAPEPPYSRSAGYRSQPAPRAAFAAMVTRIDRDVGRLVARLREKGLDRRTLVLFTSDNGPHREGGADPEFFDSNGPLRGIKRDLYEGGIRVPMIAWWPGTVPVGVRDAIWAHWDVLPTLADLAGATAPAGLDGTSMRSVLTGGAASPQERTLYWEFHERGFQQAARKGRWKAVRLGADRPIEIYDLVADPSETTDLAARQPAVAAEFEAYFAGARTPSDRWPAKKP
jgi:quinoprotein glucose dehydrogenase